MESCHNSTLSSGLCGEDNDGHTKLFSLGQLERIKHIDDWFRKLMDSFDLDQVVNLKLHGFTCIIFT